MRVLLAITDPENVEPMAEKNKITTNVQNSTKEQKLSNIINSD